MINLKIDGQPKEQTAANVTMDRSGEDVSVCINGIPVLWFDSATGDANAYLLSAASVTKLHRAGIKTAPRESDTTQTCIKVCV